LIANARLAIAEPMIDTSEILSIEGLTKRYSRGAMPAVADVDLRVESGEVMAVVGESGCGKTTLLRLVAGLETPDEGVIRIRGATVAGPRSWVVPERRGIGMVFQDFALFPHMTVVGNIVYGLRAMARAGRQERAEEMLELVGLTGYGDRFPHQLSGGQQQRVALARALAPQPSLLLLDEPFSNLDTTLKRSLRDELREILQGTGTTALLVVHDAEDVLLLADRAAVMRFGRVLQTGDPNTLYRQPANEYVAHFFGETNVLPGRACLGGFDTPLGLVPCTVGGTAAGAVRLCLRPEDLQFVPESEAGRPAVVRRVRVTGTRRRVVVSLENGSDPEATLTVETGPEMPLAVGDRVYVWPKPDCAHVLASE
jgi:iron(III) transport system ATP-binding protein